MPLTKPKKMNKSLLLSIPITLFSSSLFASNLYVGGQFGSSYLLNDEYFDQFNGDKIVDDRAAHYSVIAGYSVNNNFHLELELGAHHPFQSKSTLSYSFQKLTLEDRYVRSNIKYDFYLKSGYYYYLKGGLGVVQVEHFYQNSSATQQQTDRDIAIYPSIAVGLQKNFDRHFSLYGELQYSGYKLSNNNDSYTMSYGSMTIGAIWKF